MSRITWRWEERDFGFRYRSGTGRQAAELYQARHVGEYYIVPRSQRKLSKARADAIAKLASPPALPRIVAIPWENYDRDWDWIATEDGICLNWAGCLDQEELHRREDEGVQRAMECVTGLVERAEAVRLSLGLIKRIHVLLMGAIYPFAGEWRTVSLHKGEGPTRWPLPPGGIQPVMDVLEQDVLSRSPLLTEDDDKVFGYASEVMNEVLAVHPFREGNGRTAFIIGNLILMQNELLPLTTYERQADEARYFAACDAGRVLKDYAPLAALLAEWEDRALARWRELHG